MTIALTSENFDEIIKNDKVVFIDFWAPWCGPCRMFGPIFETVSSRHNDAVFAKCDTQEQAEIASQFGIRSIPTIIALKDGKIIFSQAGALPENVFEKLVIQLKTAKL